MDPTNWDISTKEGMANAVQWMKAHISRIAKGGLWIVPRSVSIYVIDHANKTATKRSGFPEPEIARVFRAMGWTVVDESEPEDRWRGRK